MVGHNRPRFKQGDEIHFQRDNYPKEKVTFKEYKEDDRAVIIRHGGLTTVPLDMLSEIISKSTPKLADTINGDVTFNLNVGSGKKRKRSGHATHYHLLNKFVDEYLKQLEPQVACVWMVMLRDARDGSVKSSLRDIANRAGTNAMTVSRAIKVLAKKKLLRIVRKGGYKRGISEYLLRIPSTKIES